MKYFTILLAILLVGCSSTKQPDMIIKNHAVLITVPDVLLVKCEPTKPPQLNNYLDSSYKDKEDMLTNYSINLLSDINKCNNQLSSISEYQTNAAKNVVDK